MWNPFKSKENDESSDTRDTSETRVTKELVPIIVDTLTSIDNTLKGAFSKVSEQYPKDLTFRKLLLEIVDLEKLNNLKEQASQILSDLSVQEQLNVLRQKVAELEKLKSVPTSSGSKKESKAEEELSTDQSKKDIVSWRFSKDKLLEVIIKVDGKMVSFLPDKKEPDNIVVKVDGEFSSSLFLPTVEGENDAQKIRNYILKEFNVKV